MLDIKTYRGRIEGFKNETKSLDHVGLMAYLDKISVTLNELRVSYESVLGVVSYDAEKEEVLSLKEIVSSAHTLACEITDYLDQLRPMIAVGIEKQVVNDETSLVKVGVDTLFNKVGQLYEEAIGIKVNTGDLLKEVDLVLESVLARDNKHLAKATKRRTLSRKYKLNILLRTVQVYALLVIALTVTNYFFGYREVASNFAIGSTKIGVVLEAFFIPGDFLIDFVKMFVGLFKK